MTNQSLRCARWLPLAGLVLVLACSGQAPPDEARIDDDTVSTLLTVEELPLMPSYPEADRGRLVTVSAGDHDLHPHGGRYDRQRAPPNKRNNNVEESQTRRNETDRRYHR